ncbi:hypothetical protein Tco_0001214 [Tanacetum coccineum]
MMSKLVNICITTNFDRLHAYLEQYELHANEVRLMHERSQDPLELVANYQMTPSHFNTYQSPYHNPQFNQQTHLAEFLQIDSDLAVPVFEQGDGPIDAINKMMSFLNKSFILQRKTGGNYARSTKGSVKCFNCQSEGNGKVLNEEELEFLADPGIAEAKAVLMTNLYSFGSDVLSDCVIAKETNVISIDDSEETLMLDEESRSKMILVNILSHNKNCLINKLLHLILKRNLASSLSKIEAPRKLPKLDHTEAFNSKEEWGFEHTKAVFLNEVIQFLKTLKDIFNVFDKDLLNEITEVQTVFNQMEAVVQQYHVDK